MTRINKLAANVAGAAAVAMLLGTSAFADSRPLQATSNLRDGSQEQQTQRQDRRDRDNRDQQRQGHSWTADSRTQQQTARQYDRQQTYNRDQNTNRNQNYDRNRGYDRQQTYNRDQTYNRNQNYDRNRGYDRQQTYNRDQTYNRNQNYDRNRGYDRNNGYNRDRAYRNDTRRSYGAYDRDNRRHVYNEGRVSRIMHERDGYRVWLSGGRDSYWVPEARWRLWPLRVGLSVRIGGYYDPFGYVDAYEIGPLGGPIYTGGDLRGVVESVDYARGIAVIRDDISGAFVTAVLRGGDPQMGDIRPGDYVDFTGNWTRRGYFEAYQIAGLNPGQY